MADEKNTAGVINPHDKVFKKTYSDRENACSFLTHYLPDKVLKLVDLNTLEISKDSFIEKDLADYYSDILYKVDLTDGSRGFIYVLFEHKSYHDRFVHLQIKEIAEQAISKETGGYVMTLAEKLRREGEERGKLEGKLEGRLEGQRNAIELGMTLKFPEDIEAVMVRVNQINDIDILDEITQAIKTAKDSSEILALLK
jgi:predicted transposase YdaD